MPFNDVLAEQAFHERGFTLHAEAGPEFLLQNWSCGFQEGTLRGVKPDGLISFRIEQGCIGATTFEIFNLMTPTPLLIGRCTHLTCNSTRFDIASAGLVTVDVPPTPTPEPPLIFPAAPKTGRSVSWCEGASPWQICQMALQDSQFQPAQPITGALPFRGNVSAISWSPDGRRLTFSAGQVPN